MPDMLIRKKLWKTRLRVKKDGAVPSALDEGECSALL
jgi:hypothetical protein